MAKVSTRTPPLISLYFCQERGDPDYGSCLWAVFNFDLERYELSITSDCGNYAYGWVPTHKSESFMHLMARLDSGYLLDMLTVIKRVEDRKPGRPMWLCQCECGNTVVVSSTNLLRTNSTKSCGCLRHTSSPTLIDLRGKTFGKLKVIEKDPDSKPCKAKWICECKCGNIVSVLSDSLRNGKTRSCGCARSQIKHDLTNQTFGFLKVIEPVKNERIKGNETRWKCLCQNCGRTVEVSSYWLRHSDPYGHCKCTRFNKPL